MDYTVLHVELSDSAGLLQSILIDCLGAGSDVYTSIVLCVFMHILLIRTCEIG